MTGGAERFWDFSLRFYRHPQVQETCLRLQDEAALNVNLALWCCWHATRGRRLSRADVEAARNRLDDWSREVTQPLRTLRRNLKPAEDGDDMTAARRCLYERMKAAELEAERVEQILLCRECAPGRTVGKAEELLRLALANLNSCLDPERAAPDRNIGAVLVQRLARRLAAMGDFP